MTHTVVEVWDEWKRLTRFLECSKIAFRRELGIWSNLELPDIATTKLTTQNGKSKFQLTALEHIETLQDENLLYFIVLTYSYSLCECYARIKLGLDDCARLDSGIEVWGDKLLKTTNNTWNDVHGGRAGIIEVSVARNFISHGSRLISQSTLNRFQSLGETCPWEVRDSFRLDYEKVEIYRSRLKSLMRLGNT